MKNGKTIAYFVTEDWYFCSHRLQLAIAARNAGYTVYVITRVTAHGEAIKSAGLNLIPIKLSRRGKNLFSEAVLIGQLIRIYLRIRPQIVHHVAIKPVIYGSIAAWVAHIPTRVNALAGLGYLFSATSVMANLLRPIVIGLYRMLLNNEHSMLILQNPDDIEMLCGNGIVDPSKVKLILGSGVDTDEYRHRPESSNLPIVLLPSRMLWDKGVGEFVEAAKFLKQDGIIARFILAGGIDDQNPMSIPENQLEKWNSEEYVEWWGLCSDMPAVLAESHVVCLPSYREGLPKVLVEAASCGRPIVTTDAPGCREIVIDGDNGFLVPIKDVDALVCAIRRLLKSPVLRSRMGLSGRQLVKRKFSQTIVIDETLTLYELLIQ